MEETIPNQAQVNPSPRMFVHYAGQGKCRSCDRETTLAMVFVSENPQAHPAGGPWCQECCETWRQFNSLQSEPATRFSLGDMVCAGKIRIQPLGRTYELIEVEPWADGAVIGTAVIKRAEVPADPRERRRLVSAKLQKLGDALLAAMEQVVAEKGNG